MPYLLTAEKGKTLASYVHTKHVSPITHMTECVAFLQATIPGMPNTHFWRPGKKVTRGDVTIEPGTAIATFVDGAYPGPGRHKHAAIYMGQDAEGIQVLDQWAGQGEVLPRT